MVGPAGGIVGVDMTPGMLDRACPSAAKMGAENVEYRQGFAESLPVADGWADVVISNGVLNLFPISRRAYKRWRGCSSRPAAFRLETFSSARPYLMARNAILISGRVELRALCWKQSCGVG